MRFEIALVALRDKHIVRRAEWPADECWLLSETGIHSCNRQGERWRHRPYEITIKDILAEDWEVVQRDSH